MPITVLLTAILIILILAFKNLFHKWAEKLCLKCEFHIIFVFCLLFVACKHHIYQWRTQHFVMGGANRLFYDDGDDPSSIN